MRYLPYALLLLSFALGYAALPYGLVGVVALVATFLLFAPRRRALRDQPQAPDQNLLLDGAFLLASQLLIHFVAFAVGVLVLRSFGG